MYDDDLDDENNDETWTMMITIRSLFPVVNAAPKFLTIPKSARIAVPTRLSIRALGATNLYGFNGT